MSQLHYQVDEGVALITLNRPPVNALAMPLRRQLSDALYAAMNDAAVNAIVITGAARGFCGGADIAEFGLPVATQEPNLPSLFSYIEASAKPVVAALHGMALGGGLELALACHARVAQAQTLVGLPEVTLGLLPGAGGTQRLPRLVGLETALNMIVQGQMRQAHTLRNSGLFDAVVDADAVAHAMRLARELAAQVAAGNQPRRSSALPVQMPNAQAYLSYARAAVTAQARGLPAPVACVDCLEAAATLPAKEGLAREAEAFTKLLHSPESAGLRHAFLAERGASHIEGLADDVKPRTIQQVAVIGAGTMGSGIAMSLANSGIDVVLIEREQAALDRGLGNIRQQYEATAKKGRLTAEQVTQRVSAIRGELDFAAAGKADLVIEAAFENMAVKHQIFERLDAIAKPGAILATNTSMLDVNQIAAITRRPADVLGLHFFSPAHVMKLLEVVRAERTAPEVLATALSLAKRVGKTAVVSGVCEGFIGNRMLMPYLIQAGLLLDEGALPQQVDRAIENFGMAMGPFKVSDLSGNDLGAHIREQYAINHPDRVWSKAYDAVVNMGRFGQKVGRGWYDYLPGQRAPQPSDEVNAAIVAESQRLGIKRRHLSDEEIVTRLWFALVNEGAKILEEGIAQRAADIDVVYLAGYGFPRWRGGPMFAADRHGLGDVLASMQRFAQGPAYQHSDAFWQPAALLTKLAGSGQSFSSYNESKNKAEPS